MDMTDLILSLGGFSILPIIIVFLFITSITIFSLETTIKFKSFNKKFAHTHLKRNLSSSVISFLIYKTFN
jgi:hypothetical protein